MRTRLVALCAVLILLSGCIGVSGPTNSTSTPTTTTPTATPSPTTISYTDCPYILHAEAASDQQASRINETLSYDALTEERQQEFRQALEHGDVEIGTTLPDTWSGPRIVTYEGDQYYTVAAVC